MNPRLVVLLLTLPVVLAGCTEEAPVTAFHATATKPSFSHGWAYGGNVTAGEGEVRIDVDEATNQGRVEATVTLPDGVWTILWTNFSGDPTKAFQSGGIARDFMEHGDTGVGDALIPALHLVSAGWGRAEVRKDGVPFLDPIGGGAWVAHYMATDTGVRAPDGKIRAKSGAYDPANPANGANEPGDNEIWIVLRPSGAAPDDLLVNATEEANHPQYTKEFPFTVDAPGAPVVVRFATRAATAVASPVPTWDLTFTLVDANGTEVAAAKNEGILESPGAPGDYKVLVSGAAVQASYDLAVVVDYPSNDPYVVVFEEASW